MSLLLKTHNLSLSYTELNVFNNINLELEENIGYTLIGPSGCGKTSLLLCLANLLYSYTGDIHYLYKKNNQSIIFQNNNLLPWKKAWENIVLGLKKSHLNQPYKKAKTIMQQMDIYTLSKKYPHEMSGGQKQKIALAKALIEQPKLMLLDEPFSSLDELNREQLTTFFIDLWKKKPFCFLIITHSLEEAVYLGQKILIFDPESKDISLFENQHSYNDTFRNSHDFYERCSQLRQRIKIHHD